VLSIEELTKCESMSVRWVELKLMEEESIIMVLEKINLNIFISEFPHVLEGTTGKTLLSDKGMSCLTHQEHWEVFFFVLVGLLEEIHNNVKSVLI
jgi:hypothetical protein